MKTKPEVIWNPLDKGLVKLNFDGTLRGNPRPSGAGGLVTHGNGQHSFITQWKLALKQIKKQSLLICEKG